jgi:methyl-accepting chemotaxis protein
VFTKKKELLYILIPLIILLSIGYGFYIYNLQQKEEKQIIQSLMTKSTELDNWFVDKKKILKNLAKSLGTVKYDKKIHLKLMNKELKDMTTNSIFTGYEDGKYFDTQGYWSDGFDPRTRPWYKETFNNKKITITGPMYYNDISGQKVRWWGLSAGLFKEAKPFGVVSGEILPKMLRKYLKEIHNDKIEHLFLFNKKTGLILSAINRNKELKHVQNIFSEELFNNLLQNKRISFVDNHINKIAYTSRLVEAPWILCAITLK